MHARSSTSERPGKSRKESRVRGGEERRGERRRPKTPLNGGGGRDASPMFFIRGRQGGEGGGQENGQPAMGRNDGL